MAGSKLRKRESQSMNYWLRARVIAQGFTIAAVVLGSWMMGQTKPQLDQAAAAAAADGDESSGKSKRKAEFEERLRGAEESHKLEMAATIGKGPLGQRQTPVVEPPKVSIPEAKDGGKYWPGWSVLGKVAWFGGSTTKTPPSTPVTPPSTPTPSSSVSDDKRA
jgi:Hypoxia induced protein conserved region